MPKRMLWMAVTPDKYELPIAIEDSALSLAIRMGTTENNIASRAHRNHSGVRKGYKVVKIAE